MVATQTRHSRVLVGGDTWSHDLNLDSHGFTLNDTLNETNEPASARPWVERLLTEYSRTISVPTIFYGDATEALSPRTEGISLAVLGDAVDATGNRISGWVGGPATWISIPRVAPQSGIVSGGVDFMERAAWGSGDTVVPFNFSAGDTTAIFTDVLNTSVAYIALITKSVTGSRVFTIGDGTDDVTISFDSVGVKAVDLSSLANNISTGSISAASLTGDQTIEGYFVAGTEYTIPSGALS